MQYHAFLSYSHADGRIARALQSGLQRLAKPWFRRPVIKIFRDQTSLSANPGLWSEIERNLGRSQFFVLLASRAAARSEWVEREVAWWATHRPIENVLLVVTDGTVRWDRTANDFDWSATTCLPRSLGGRFKEEPLYADLTWATDKDDLSLRHSQFRAAVLDLAAPLHGKPKDELDSEDIRQNRRLRTATWSGVATIVALAIGAMIAAWFAVQNANEAIANAITATSRQHAVEAQLMIGQGRLGDAVTSALRAFRTENTTDARSALFQTFEAARDIYAVLRGHQRAVWAARFGIPLGELLTWSADNVLIVWDLPTRRAIRAVHLGEAVDVRSATFSPDSRVLAVGIADGSIRLWDMQTMQERGRLKGGNSSAVSALAFDPAGNLLAAGYELGGRILVWDLRHPGSAPSTLEQGKDDPAAASALSFSSDGRYLAAADETPLAGVSVWTVPAGKFVTSLARTGRFSMNERVAFARHVGEDEPVNDLIVGTSEGIVQTFRMTTGRLPQFQRVGSSVQHQGSVSAIAVGFASFATGGRDGLVSVFGPTNERTVTPASWSKASVQSLAFSDGEEYLAAGATDGTVTVYYGRLQRPRTTEIDTRQLGYVDRSPRGRWLFRNINRPGVVPSFTVTDAATRRVALEGLRGGVVFSPDDRWVAASDGDSTSLWEVSAQQPSRQPVLALTAHSASFSRSGRFLVTKRKTNNGEIHVFDLGTGAPTEQRFQQSPSGDFHGFSADERLLITIDGQHLQLWDVARGERVGPTMMLEPLDDDDEDSYRIELSADSRWLLAGQEGGPLSLHRVADSEASRPFPIEHFRAAAFSADGRWFAAGKSSEEGLFDLATLMPLFQANQEEYGNWRFTKDSRWALRISRDGVQAWNLQRKSPRPTVLSRSLANVELSADDRWAVVQELPDSGQVQLWNLTGSTAEGKTVPIKKAWKILFTPDSRRLLTTESEDDALTMWDVATLERRQIATLSSGRTPAHAFSPDGRVLAIEANGNGRIVLLRLPEGDVIGQLDGHTKEIYDIEYSPDGTVLAAIDADGSLSFWDAGARKLGDTLAGPGGKEDPDYRVKVGADGRINGMPLHPSMWIEDVCQRTDPKMSREEWQRVFGTVPFPSACDDVNGITRENLVQPAP